MTNISQHDESGQGFSQSDSDLLNELMETRSIIPVKDKKPAIEEWTQYQKRRATEDEVRGWINGNTISGINAFAQVTGTISGVITLDFDGPAGCETFKRLGLPAHRRTGSGGLHIDVALPGFEVRSQKLYAHWPGLEIKGDGGIVVVVGWNSSGKYQWLTDSIEPLPWSRLPADLRDDIKGEPASAVGAGRELDLKDYRWLPRAYELVDRALEKAKEGAGRNNTGAWLAEQLRDLGATEEEVVDLGLEWWQPRAALLPDAHGQMTPYSKTEWLATVKSVFSRDAREEPKWTPVVIGRKLRETHRLAKVGQALSGGAAALAVYDRSAGVYRLGEALLWNAAEAMLGPAWSKRAFEEGLNWLRASPDTPQLWEKPPLDEVNVLNGIVNVHSGRLREHSPDFLSLVQIPVRYDATATCPDVEKFICEALPEDVVPSFYELAGWLLVPDVTVKRAVCFFGPGDTGKTTAINLLQAMLGEGNFSNVELQNLSTRFMTHQLVGKLANFFDDLPNTSIRNTSTFKVLTGRGRLTVEEKHKPAYSVQPFARQVFSANELPRTTDTTEAYFGRWWYLPFMNKVPEQKKDRNLEAKLTTPQNLSGFLNLALAGYQRLTERGDFTASASSERMARDYRLATDVQAAWVYEHCDFVPEGRVLQVDLVKAYKAHYKENISARGGPSSQAINDHLQSLDEWRTGTVAVVKHSTGRPAWKGIAWKVRDCIKCHREFRPVALTDRKCAECR